MAKKDKVTILRETEELLNELEAIRGRTGILETQIGAVFEVYKYVAAANEPFNLAVEQALPMVMAFAQEQATRATPRQRTGARRTPRRSRA